VITPQFEDAFAFSEGKAIVKANSRFGYIDSGGKISVPTQFEGAGDFRQGTRGRSSSAGKYRLYRSRGQGRHHPTVRRARALLFRTGPRSASAAGGDSSVCTGIVAIHAPVRQRPGFQRRLGGG
jgi:hypothetical protein